MNSKNKLLYAVATLILSVGLLPSCNSLNNTCNEIGSSCGRFVTWLNDFRINMNCNGIQVEEPKGESFAMEKIISVANASIKGGETFTSEKNESPITYTGLGVSSLTPYSGMFNATFTNDINLTYKFPGQASVTINDNAIKTTPTEEEYYLCDGNGDFYFTITSVADSAKTFTYHLQKTENGTGDVTAYIYCEDTYAVRDMAKTRYMETLNDALQYQNQSQILGFNSNEISLVNGFEFKKDNGIWKFIVKDAYYSLSLERSYELAVFDGAHNLPNWDFSEGYTINFGTEYSQGIDWDGDNVAEDFGTDICFLSINGETLSSKEGNLVYKGATSKEIRYPSEQNLNNQNIIELKLGDTLEDFSYTTIGRAKIGNAIFNIPLTGEEIALDVNLDTSSVGMNTVTVSHESLSKEYEIRILPILNEQIDYELIAAEGADLELLGHTSKYAKGGSYYYYPIGTSTYKFSTVNYKGMTLTSDTPYRGQFKTVFKENTTIYYKLPGTAEDESKIGVDAFKIYNTNKNFNFGVGDGDGNFYFKVTSVADPTHAFTYNISPTKYDKSGASVSTSGGFANARQWVECVNESGTKVLSTISNNSKKIATTTGSVDNFKQNTAHFNFFNSSELINNIHFRLYKNANGYWAVNAYYPHNRSREWYSHTMDFAVFDGNAMPNWDFSEGYTIEFGSNYDTGSDVCFIGINSDKTNRTDYSVATTNLSILHEDEFLEDGKNKITLTAGEKLQFSLIGTGKTYDVIGERRSEEVVGAKTITHKEGGTYFDVTQTLKSFEYSDIDTTIPGTYEITVKYGGVSKMYTIEIIEEVSTTSLAMPVSLNTASNEKFTITFLDANGNVHESGEYSYGDTVNIPAAPTKQADQTYRYNFDYWSPDVTTVSGDAIYTPVFVSIFIEYEVKFVDEDGKFISGKADYHYGDTVIVPENPTKAEDEKYIYMFAGWDKEVTTVKKNVTYKATYTKTAKEVSEQTQSNPLDEILAKVGCNNSVVGGGFGGFALLTAIACTLLKKRRQ